MNIFVVNSGSSSIKYQLFRMPNEKPVCSGLVDRIGLGNSEITHKIFDAGREMVVRKSLYLKDHEAGLVEVNKLLTDEETGVIKDPNEIDVIGHRVVHGGEKFTATTIITEDTKKEIKKLFALAPLHNPSNYLGIEVAERIFEKAKQVAVFDTAFHHSMPEKAFRYAIPEQFYTEFGIRSYGFHGTSHKYVTAQANQYLDNPRAKIVTVHLGNGCSMAAVDGGKVVDTSMGFGPLAGLIMGTRSGDIDPSIIFHLINELGFSPDKVRTMLNKESGMIGLTGFSDMRDVTKSIESGDENARLAYEMYAYRVKKYIGAYAAALNGLDAIVFTAGVGENDVKVRELICTDMGFFGLKLDPEKNQIRSVELREINTADSQAKILVIPTNEELEITRQCYELLMG